MKNIILLLSQVLTISSSLWLCAECAPFSLNRPDLACVRVLVSSRNHPAKISYQPFCTNRGVILKQDFLKGFSDESASAHETATSDDTPLQFHLNPVPDVEQSNPVYSSFFTQLSRTFIEDIRPKDVDDEYHGYPVKFIRHAIPNHAEHTPWDQWTEEPYVFIGYHGTSQYGAIGIANQGYEVNPRGFNSQGLGVYVTPELYTARIYANGCDNIMDYVDDGEPNNSNARICYFFAPKSLMDDRLLNKNQEDAVNRIKSSNQDYPITEKEFKLPWAIVYPPETLKRLKMVSVPSMPESELPVVFPFSVPFKRRENEPFQVRTVNLKQTESD